MIARWWRKVVLRRRRSGLLRQDILLGVIWAGFLQYQQLPRYYGLANAFIHPPKSEPWGLVVNEAAASSLPLLVSNTVGAGYELVRDGFNGFLFDPNSATDISEALLRLARHREFDAWQLARDSVDDGLGLRRITAPHDTRAGNLVLESQ